MMRLFTGGDQARNKGTLRQLVLALGILVVLSACGGNETNGTKDIFTDDPTGAAPSRAGIAGLLTGGDKFAAASADESLAAEVGRDVLSGGGNATDAAVAMYFTMAVTLPSAAGLGASGACIVHDAKTRAAESFVFAPVAAPGPIKGQSFMVPVGPRAVTLMHIRHGKLQWSQLLAPAERMARNGFPVPRSLSRDLQAGATLLGADSEARRIYGKGGSTAITEGDIWAPTDLAATIGVLRQRGGGDFFAGNFARLLSTQITSIGGSLPSDTLRNALPVSGPPASVNNGGFKVYVAPAPLAGADALAGWNNQGASSGAVPTDSGGIAGLAAVDSDGNAAACSLSMGQVFGTRIIVPGTGILLGALTPTSAAVSPVVIGNPNNGEFRFVGAGGGGPTAAYATGAVARQAVDRGSRIGAILAARRGQGGYVNAIACPDGIRSYGSSCNTGIDPAGTGLALTAPVP
jgi:gamma-glutamyltranspeptidase / glutathione hydrolase